MRILPILAATALLSPISVILPYYPENLVWPVVPPSAPELVVTNADWTNYVYFTGPSFTNTWPTAKQFVEQMKASGELTNVVNLLATNGTFCVVRGHIWLQEINVIGFYDPSVVGRRRCGVCNLYQEQRATEWK